MSEPGDQFGMFSPGNDAEIDDIFRCNPCECGGHPDCLNCNPEEIIIPVNFFIQYDDQREEFEEKHGALRRAAALSKFKKAVIKVYNKQGTFIKSFDGR